MGRVSEAVRSPEAAAFLLADFDAAVTSLDYFRGLDRHFRKAALRSRDMFLHIGVLVEPSGAHVAANFVSSSKELPHGWAFYEGALLGMRAVEQFVPSALPGLTQVAGLADPLIGDEPLDEKLESFSSEINVRAACGYSGNIACQAAVSEIEQIHSIASGRPEIMHLGFGLVMHMLDHIPSRYRTAQSPAAGE